MADPPHVPYLNHLVSLPVLLFSQAEEADDTNSLNAMIDVMKVTAPDLKHGPPNMRPAVQSFYDFETPLSTANAAAIASELEEARPDGYVHLFRKLTTQVVLNVKAALVTEEIETRVPYQNLAFFLDTCYNELGRDEEREDIREVFLGAMTAVKAKNDVDHREHVTPNVAHFLKVEESDPEAIGAGMRKFLEVLVIPLDGALLSSMERFGFVQQHASMSDLIDKVARPSPDQGGYMANRDHLQLLRMLKQGEDPKSSVMSSLLRKTASGLEVALRGNVWEAQLVIGLAILDFTENDD
ncbi:uncharacterized protein LTR77_005926 [Saxophila tyrrhenica]|uniref:Uncharacterized protein n=1 Tax=Saxophila tyrrhenica TaxID=1690608 RepID=A0AAV9PAG1_9PEZI|nr:hypothetical protein LTR77_005926 [Saxophila tyrrhenica]